jgi:hypothetical protein
METSHSSESSVSQASISARALALEQKEAEVEAAKSKEPKIEEKKEAIVPESEEKEEKKPEAKEPEKKVEDKKVEDKPSKKQPNDPEELRKWNVRTSQENSKLRKEMADLKDAQEKTYKLLASLSKKPIDYKELAKTPEALEKFVESERQALTEEYQEQLEQLATQAKEKDTIVERMRREQDTENYPRWKELYTSIVKIAVGPTGQGDPRVDFTKPASEVLDALYEIAIQENPKGAEPVKETPAVKTFTEEEVKSMVADMVAKERESISKAAREDAAKEAQEALRREAAGGTVASAGKGAGRIPSDHLAAFKKMSLGEQRDWLIAQQQANS